MPFSSSRLYFDTPHSLVPVNRPCLLPCIKEVDIPTPHDSALDLSAKSGTSPPAQSKIPETADLVRPAQQPRSSSLQTHSSPLKIPALLVTPPSSNETAQTSPDESVSHSVIFRSIFPLLPVHSEKSSLGGYTLKTTRVYKLDYQDYIRCELNVSLQEKNNSTNHDIPALVSLEQLAIRIRAHIDHIGFLIPSILKLGTGLEMDIEDDGSKVLNGAICIPFETGFIPALYAALESVGGDTSLPDFSVDGTLVLECELGTISPACSSESEAAFHPLEPQSSRPISFFLPFESLKTTREHYDMRFLSPVDCKRILYEKRLVEEPF